MVWRQRCGGPPKSAVPRMQFVRSAACCALPKFVPRPQARSLKQKSTSTQGWEPRMLLHSPICLLEAWCASTSGSPIVFCHFETASQAASSSWLNTPTEWSAVGFAARTRGERHFIRRNCRTPKSAPGGRILHVDSPDARRYPFVASIELTDLQSKTQTREQTSDLSLFGCHVDDRSQMHEVGVEVFFHRLTGQQTGKGTWITATCRGGLTRQSISVSSPPEATG